MNSINIIIFCVLTIGCTHGCVDFDSADRCMQETIIIGNPDLRFPETNQEMDRHCGSIAGSEKCVKDYSDRCLDPLAKQVATVITNNAVKTSKDYCTHAQRRKAILRLGKCANARKDLLDQLMFTFIDNLQAIDAYPDKNKRIPMLCCNYNKFKSDIIGHANTDRNPRCPDGAFDEIEHLVEGFASETMGMICPSEYQGDSGDKCKAILALTPQIKSTENRKKSMLMPLINMFKNM